MLDIAMELLLDRLPLRAGQPKVKLKGVRGKTKAEDKPFKKDQYWAGTGLHRKGTLPRNRPIKVRTIVNHSATKQSNRQTGRCGGQL